MLTPIASGIALAGELLLRGLEALDRATSTGRSTVVTTTTSSCRTTASGATTEPTARVSATAAERSWRSSWGGLSGCAATTTHSVAGHEPGVARGGELRARGRRAAREQVLEQVAPHPLALRVQEALGLEVDLGRPPRPRG